MIKVSWATITHMEKNYPGITGNIFHFELMKIPPCEHCESANTASVQAGFIGRTINIAVATTKFKLFANYNGKGIYFCNSCKAQFGPKERSNSRGSVCLRG